MLFSVITVTRNNLEGLRRTHESLRAQSCADYEWIVIDGASDDGTAGYLQGTGAVWLSESDRGIYDAMNKGIDRARGDHLIFMNAGDVFAAPDVLEKLAAHGDADFIYGDAREGGACKRARSYKKISYGMFTHHQSMMYGRDKIGALRYDTNYKIAADYKFTVEFLRRAEKIVYTPFPVCVFEQGGVSQKNVRPGRTEQFRIRRELNVCSLPKNILIYAMQTFVMACRCAMPSLYWRVRKICAAANESLCGHENQQDRHN